MYLRNFTSLKSVNLVDNPMTSSEDYRLLMLVYVPQLKYIDYSLVNDDQVWLWSIQVMWIQIQNKMKIILPIFWKKKYKIQNILLHFSVQMWNS